MVQPTPASPTEILVSAVIPVYNSGNSVRQVVEGLMAQGDLPHLEIVLVNDGSKDDSPSTCRALADEHPEVVRYLQLARNFGEHNAVMAGLNHVSGDIVVILDDDMQNPPSEVPRMVRAMEEQQVDVLYTRYQTKRHSFFRNLGSRFNDLVAHHLTDKPKGLYLCSFKAIRRFVVDEVVRYQGPYPYIDGLILRCTQNIGTLEVHHEVREEGESSYNLRRLVALWLNMSINFSLLPLRLAMLTGCVSTLIAVIYAVVTVIEKMLLPDMPVGYPTLIIFMCFFFGVQMILLGVIGEYLGRLFISSNASPQFFIREQHGRGSHGS